MRYSYSFPFINIKDLCGHLCTKNRQLVQIRYYYSPFKKHLNEPIYKLQQSYAYNIRKIKNAVIRAGHYIKKPIVLPREMMEKLKETFAENELYTYVEKGIDVHIAIDLVNLSSQNSFDVAILISGDTDFLPAVKLAKKSGKHITIAAFVDPENSCVHLRNTASSFIDLHHHVPQIIYEKQKSHSC